MKKILAIVVALNFCVLSSVLAANPFADITSEHWAYVAVRKLVAQKIITGVDGKYFDGNRTITRYEAAQIVAKALAQGVKNRELQNLAQEFTAELANLGLRVAKIEEKIQVSGQIDIRHRNVISAGALRPAINDYALRTRLHLGGTINNNWNTYIMLENVTRLDVNSTHQNSFLYLRRAVAMAKYDKMQIFLGRVPYTDKDAMLFNAVELDGIVANYNWKDIKVTALYGRFAPLNNSMGVMKDGQTANSRIDSMGIALDWQASKKISVSTAFYNHNLKNIYSFENQGSSSNVYDIMGTYKVDKWKFSAMYVGANKEILPAASKNGYIFRISHGNYIPNQKGSWMIAANYMKIPVAAMTLAMMPLEDYENSASGGKGWSLFADYALEKNVRVHFSYVNIKGVDQLAARTKAYTAQLGFFF